MDEEMNYERRLFGAFNRYIQLLDEGRTSKEYFTEHIVLCCIEFSIHEAWLMLRSQHRTNNLEFETPARQMHRHPPACMLTCWQNVEVYGASPSARPVICAGVVAVDRGAETVHCCLGIRTPTNLSFDSNFLLRPYGAQ